jgi:hypothetical protein
MPYARSAALKQLHGRLDDLQRVTRSAGKLKVGGKKNPLLRESMYSSVILLSFAHFESYVSDVSADLCKALCSANKPAKALNDSLRAHVSVASQLSAWKNIQDPAKLRKQIWLHKGANGFELLSDAASPVWIDPTLVLAGIGYPKPDNIKKFLGRLGIADSTKALQAVGGLTIMQKLTSIHDARVELAHTGKLPSWAHADYELRVKGLREFAGVLDRVLWRYVCASVPSKQWIS